MQMDLSYRHDPAQIDLRNTAQDQLADLALEDRICPGCKLSAVSENGGLVVAFGQSFFHVDCFRCAKCGDQVTADTNLLLLSDGSPICANCSYSCSICREPILDEAIMTGDDSYHAHCFKCKVCKNRIDELVFAKTSQGIYCMDCHNERMIKIRKHNERKAERERQVAMARDRENPAQSSATPQKPKMVSRPSNSSSTWNAPPNSSPSPSHTTSSTPNIPVVIAPPQTPQKTYAQSSVDRPAMKSSNSSLGSMYNTKGNENTNGGPSHLSSPLTSPGALHTSSTPMQNKRRSINPGLTLNRPALHSPNPPSSSLSPTLSPMSAQFPRRSPSPTDRKSASLSSRGSIASLYHSPANSGSETDMFSRPSPSPAHSRFPVSRQDSASSREERPASAGSLIGNRPASRATVPHSVESASESEHENDESEEHTISRDLPPLPPPKSPSSDVSRLPESQELNRQESTSEESESSPVETTSHATFIAPALPPIRFSLTTADFADLFNSVGTLPGGKSLHSLSEAQQHRANGEKTVINGDSRTELRTTINSEDAALEGGAHPPTSRTNGSLSSSAKVQSSTTSPEVVVTAPDSNVGRTFQQSSDVVLHRLQEALVDSKERGAQQMKLDITFVEAIIKAMGSRNEEFEDLKRSFDGMKRQSKQAMDGLTVAQVEYDRELKGRRDAEAEVTRLRVLLSGQTARLTVLSGDSRRQELRQQMSKDLHDNLHGLEQDLSKLKVQRDMTLAEVEELSIVGSSSVPDPPAQLGRSMTMRLDKLKTQYQRDLLPLTQQREALSREIMELKATRELYLEETTVLNARNEELAQLSAQYARHIDTNIKAETSPETPPKQGYNSRRPSEERPLHHQVSQNLQTMPADDGSELRPIRLVGREMDQPTPSKGGKFMKWPGSKPKDAIALSPVKATQEHNFQQTSVLRLTRCDHCGDKMWGSQLRCTGCNISVHGRCIHGVPNSCTSQLREEQGPMPPSMFGRDLTEQVLADARGGDRQVPVIVEKCIEAVEVLALEYEGIYRKTGGSGQSKSITQLFERGDYDAFDLCDTDRFNDICSVTSVLKTYFRTLPNPLLTYDLHDSFMAAVEIKDVDLKDQTLSELVMKLPAEHYYTLRMLMLHLHRIFERCEINLMNARNLGVVFGPTLMRSRNPGAEFSDMAGKALSVEWLIENAVELFNAN